MNIKRRRVHFIVDKAIENNLALSISKGETPYLTVSNDDDACSAHIDNLDELNKLQDWVTVENK